MGDSGMKKGQVFFYRVRIMRDGNPAIREGILRAAWPLEALDEIARMAIEDWKRPLQRIELYETDENGELIATTTIDERIDRVLETHKKLKPDSGIARIAERREKRKEEPNEVPKSSVTLSKKRPLTEWNWSAECGVHYNQHVQYTCPKVETVL
jgi:hypothetical protein